MDLASRPKAEHNAGEGESKASCDEIENTVTRKAPTMEFILADFSRGCSGIFGKYSPE
jgi:hypothetical protein